MHYYNQQIDYVQRLQDRVRELEETNVAQELIIAAAFDEADACRGRERRLLWTALGFGTVMVVAIMQASWLAMGR